MSLNLLAGRGVVAVRGPDAAGLLAGLLTNDVGRASQTEAIFAAMLTPQGKFLFDMFVIFDGGDGFLLDVSRSGDFTKRLAMYRLRSQVTIEDVSDTLSVYSIVNKGAMPPSGIGFVDPRLPAMGLRVIAPVGMGAQSMAYDAHRLEQGVPDPAADLLVEKDFIMEGLFDELNGLDFQKGCYVGQEMTSRMKRRTSVKNKLCRVRYVGAPPEFETPIVADNWEVGRMRTGVTGVGIAMIRFDRARKAQDESHKLMAGETEITLDPPEWLVQPDF